MHITACKVSRKGCQITDTAILCPYYQNTKHLAFAYFILPVGASGQIRPNLIRCYSCQRMRCIMEWESKSLRQRNSLNILFEKMNHLYLLFKTFLSDGRNIRQISRPHYLLADGTVHRQKNRNRTSKHIQRQGRTSYP